MYTSITVVQQIISMAGIVLWKFSTINKDFGIICGIWKIDSSHKGSIQSNYWRCSNLAYWETSHGSIGLPVIVFSNSHINASIIKCRTVKT